MEESPWSVTTMGTGWVHRGGLAQQPTLILTFGGRGSDCRRYLDENSLSQASRSMIEVTFRLQTDRLDSSAEGILALADSTGDYIIECESDAKPVFETVMAAIRYCDIASGPPQYSIWLQTDDGVIQEWIEDTLIVFTSDGDIVHNRSLLPPGTTL